MHGNCRDRGLLDAIYQDECTLQIDRCFEGSFVEPAHSNQSRHGKGGSLKAHDCFGSGLQGMPPRAGPVPALHARGEDRDLAARARVHDACPVADGRHPGGRMITRIVVYGSPAPLGSKSFKGMAKSGRVILAESSKKSPTRTVQLHGTPPRRLTSLLSAKETMRAASYSKAVTAESYSLVTRTLKSTNLRYLLSANRTPASFGCSGRGSDPRRTLWSDDHWCNSW